MMGAYDGETGKKEGQNAERREPRNRVIVGDIWNVAFDDEGVREVGSPLEPLMDDRYGYLVLGRSGSSHKKWGRKGLLEIGAVGEHQSVGEDLFGRKVFLDAAFPHIIFICGKRGSGKSYTLGIFAEELIRASIGVGVILIDPIGIFWSLKKQNENKGEVEAMKDWGASPHSFPEVRVLVPSGSRSEGAATSDGPFSICIGEMTPEEWCQVFDLERFKTQGLMIGTALEFVRNGYRAVRGERTVKVQGKGDRYSIADIITCLETSAVITSKTEGFTPQTRRSIVARFMAASGWGIFSVEGTPLKELSSPNRVTVVDVSDPKLGDAKRSLVTGVIARKVLEGRIVSSRLEEEKGMDDSHPEVIPVTWLLIDEAHMILPHNRQTPATDALIEFAKQGRKPGCALVLATQRPAATSDEILSQVDLLVGHNLALEDDMSALRKRVPAKLPPEFASSDFIRSIPVGSGIVADQRTQQRSFIVKLRPRFSHHGGSSAMPRAFTEKKPRTAGQAQVAGSAAGIQASAGGQQANGEAPGTAHITAPAGEGAAVVTPDGIVIPIGGPATEGAERPVDGEVTEEPVKGVKWGSCILLMDPSMELLNGKLSEIPPETELTIFSRVHPTKVQVPTSVRIASSFWLSSTPSGMSIPPTAIQEMSMEIGSFLEKGRNRVLVLDGLKYLFMNNGREPVQRLIEVIHEKVLLGRHLLIARIEDELEPGQLEPLSLEMDHLIGFGPDVNMGPPPASENILSGPAPSQYGALSREDLEWMCRVLDLPVEGSEAELLDRIMERESGLVVGGKGAGAKEDDIERVRDLIEGTRKEWEEKDRMEHRIQELEDMLEPGKPGPERPPKNGRSRPLKRPREKTVVVWDEKVKKGEWAKERTMNDLMDEIAGLKEKMEHLVLERRTSDEMGKVLEGLLDRMERDKKEGLDRLSSLEDTLSKEMAKVKDEVRRPEKSDTAREEVKRGPTPVTKGLKKELAVGPSAPTKPHAVPKIKVVKKGKEAVVVLPTIGPERALEAAKKTIKRSLFKGPREFIESVTPVYVPLYRCLVAYRGGLFGGRKQGDVFIDGSTGELIRSARSGLSRSSGLMKLLEMTDKEAFAFRAILAGRTDERSISKSASITVTEAKRVLTSLQKKGLVQRRIVEGNIAEFYPAQGIYVPAKPWTSDPGLRPERSAGIEEPFLAPRVPKDQAEAVVRRVSEDVDIIQVDLVHYPMFAVLVSGEGRERYVAVDGISGKVDEAVSLNLRAMMDELPGER